MTLASQDLCVRKQTFDQQLAAVQSLCELPAKKLIHHCLVVQKLETQLRSAFPDCSLRIAGDALARLLPSETLELYFEFTPNDVETYRDAKAPKVISLARSLSLSLFLFLSLPLSLSLSLSLSISPCVCPLLASLFKFAILFVLWVVVTC